MLDEMWLKCVISKTQNQYCYTSFIHQLALDTRHKDHALHFEPVSFHGSVHYVRIPELYRYRRPH